MKIATLFCALFGAIVINAQINQDRPDYTALILSQDQGFKKSDLSEMNISSQTFDKQNGLTHIYFNQYYKNIPVHNAVLGLHLDINGHVVATNNTFVKNIESFSSVTLPKIDANEAAVHALNSTLTGDHILPVKKLQQVDPKDGSTHAFLDETIAHGEIHVSLTWLPVNNSLQLTWNVNWLSKDGQNWWNMRVSAETGLVLDQNNWITQCKPSQLSEPEKGNPSTRPVIPNDGEGVGEGKTNAKYHVFARPVESPSHNNRSLLTDPSDSLASPFSWHDDNGVAGHEYTITRGNNVYASEDKDNNNIPGFSPSGGASLNFDFSFDKTKRHTDFLDAAITNLFYWNNLMHDVWYHYGFDDASGNFQFNNYGRGGSGSDEVMAEAQDGSGTNNANFATPPDGQNPRMQMFVWNVSSTSFLLRVKQPASLAKQYLSVLAAFGPKLTTNPINGNLVLADDGSANPTLACQDLVNGSSVTGQIALIDRGNCTFLEKVGFAQDMGAKAVVIINNSSGNPITMGGTGGTGISIPSIMITKADGDKLKNALKTQTVSVSLYDSLGATGKQYDSDFDNGIICHEYGHGISNRLTGGPANSNCLTNQEQMGEGWSDFFALVMTHKPGDKGADKRGIGTYSIDEPNDGDGIRNFPYSTSLAINPVTYNNIKTFSVPHGVGSVWCSMLWDMYWDLTDKYGYDADIYNGKGGNNIAMKLVIDGMKLQPCNPGFEDGRNAILLADQINNKSKNQDMIWKVFARRGLGFSADQGSNNSRSDGTEAFDVPTFDLPSVSKTAVTEIPNGDTLKYKIVLKNITAKTIKQLTFRDTIKSGLKFINAQGCFKGAFVNPVYSATIDSIRSGDSIVCHIFTKVTAASFTNFVEITDFESGAGTWIDSTLVGPGVWVSRTNQKYKGSKSYFIANANEKSDKVFMKQFDLNSANPHLIFYHRYNSEDGWDGGVLEINNNGNWEDLGPFMIENGYNKLISVNPESNISGQKAFSGNSGKFIRTVVDLNPFKGQTTKIRFRFVSDAALGVEGWYIDDVSLVDDFVKVDNSAIVSSNQGNSASGSTNTMVLEPKKADISFPGSSHFKVSPNPFNTEINIETADKNYSLTITDVLGKLVLKTGKLRSNQQIETSFLPAGTYFLKIETSRGIEVIKLVK